ncbi:ovostatin [Trichechus manatus latirostris]|uniref:Ovostatin n=1 Tax=Trichechus manatus latirostris TaxID=127582 RepID=A0A2Y9RUF7_TRIMA|nr:ovostatin [Trichechus manatus latirostris]
MTQQQPPPYHWDPLHLLRLPGPPADLTPEPQLTPTPPPPGKGSEQQSSAIPVTWGGLKALSSKAEQVFSATGALGASLALGLHRQPSVSISRQYVLMVPVVLQEVSLETICVQLFNLTETVTLTVSIDYDVVQKTVVKEKVTRENFFKCINFEVPKAGPDPLAFITFSAQGATLNLQERRSVAIQTNRDMVFVQTDKPIYKPGQRGKHMRFRIVSLNNYLKPVNQKYPVITLTDPDGNRIQQWNNEESSGGLVQLSFPLISEPILGQYGISVETLSGEKTDEFFSVEEYVLPKFEMTVDAPENVLVVDPEFKVNVCASYTYGKPVEGEVQLTVCREAPYGSHFCRLPINSLCENFTTQLGKAGCASHLVNTSAFELYREGYQNHLEVNALVTELGTGVQLTRTEYIFINSAMVRIQFQNMDTVYKQGIPYFGQIKLLHPDNTPIPNEIVQLYLEDKTVGNYTTDISGTAQFSLDTSKITHPFITLKAIYKNNEYCRFPGWTLPYYPQSDYFVRRFYSKTNSFIKIVPEMEELRCNLQKRVTVHYLLNMRGFEDKTYTAPFNYLVISKGVIILYGQQKVEIKDNDMRGTFSIPIEVSTELAPSAIMLVYTLHPGGEMVADSTQFEIEKCFKNKVNLNFSKEKSSPGSDISLQVSAASNSLCALWAIDESVLLLRDYNQLSAQSVYNKLYYRQLYGYYFKGLDLEDSPKQPCLKREQILYNGIYYVPAWADFGRDAYDLVEAMGLKVFTNSHYRKPVLCKKNPSHPDCDDEDKEFLKPSGSFEAGGIAPFRSYVNTVRKSFPETWVWNLITTDSRGKASLPLTVPDTITQWKANGFCLDDKAGFGISPTISLTAFQPFFVDLTLPYSVVRGEAFTLKANVFNYLNRCVQISTVLKASNAYQIKRLPTEDENVCICGGERKSYAWLVTPQALGTVNLTVVAETLTNSACGDGSSESLNTGWRDTLIKPLLVEPEGIEREMTQGSLICTSGTTVSQSVVLASPENLVQDSSRAYWSVLGDLLGSAMQNLRNLLQMPFGCGEQNMALFASNIYILDYLSQTQQLTEEIKSKAIAYLIEGYQKQLSYKHSDGSYSTFRQRDQQGNTWLTAFVYKSFAQAKRYIYIDDKVQSQTLIWLISTQESDGCFPNFGNVFNNALKGQDDKISLTAYVINALIEAGHPISLVAIQNGLQCIRAASMDRAITTYEQALLAYTFTLAGYEDRRKFFINELNKKAKKVGECTGPFPVTIRILSGSVHWELEKLHSVAGAYPYYPWASSAEIEMTSYVLLAILSKPQLTSEERSYASQIVQWVAKQQNSYGGFSSTRDTVLALQALTVFQRLTFSKNRQNSVLIRSDQAFSAGFQVNDENRLLLQQTQLPTTNRNYTVEVSGNGCVYVQTILKYNILLPSKSSGFFLSVNTENAVCRGSFEKKFDLVISASYHGKRSTSNMVIIDVKMLSGFVPVRSSIEKLQRDGKVQQVETKTSHVFFYLENVTEKKIQFSFSVEQDALVSNIRPASVQLYDYYETDEYALAEYNTPCNQMYFESCYL